MPTRSIAIVGCGFAGAAAALFLARDGHDVTVFEAVPDPGPVGAGILIQPTGALVLAELGLLDPVVARSTAVGQLRAVTEAGREVFSLRYADLSPHLTGLGVHRGLLFETLFNAVHAAGIEVRCGVKVVDRGARGELLDDAGRNLGTFDLIVAADGARSELHHLVARHVRSPRYPWGALWHIGRDRDRAFGGELFQVLRGTSRMTGLLPSGTGPASGGDDTPLVSFFFSIAGDRVDAWRRSDLSAWLADIVRIEPRAASLLEDIASPDDLLYAAYHDTVMRRWDFGDLVFIGDAAHATSPQLGQGTNLALMDASSLARCLREQPDLAASLRTHSTRRRQHVRYYQLASRALTPWFQSGADLLAPLRDIGMPIATRIPWIRRQALLTLAGVKRGILRGAIDGVLDAPLLAR